MNALARSVEYRVRDDGADDLKPGDGTRKGSEHAGHHGLELPRQVEVLDFRSHKGCRRDVSRTGR